MTQATLLQTKSLTEVGEDIGLSEGKKMVSAFGKSNPDATQGYYIGRNIIDQILAQPDCVGINFRKCLTETNQEHLVYTGVNSDGKDIVEYSVVTNTGDIVKQDGIVADRIWVLDIEQADEVTRTIFDY
ncbi:MAG: hypothetical protein H0V14_10670 [Chitinophagaceae bacterium]|nr:hypothetical protein [Chitinophagaceae bacterium]